MIRFAKHASVLLLSTLISTTLFATPEQAEKDFEALKDSAVNYQQIGTICEEVAKLRLRETFPKEEFKVVTGISYFKGRRTIGELDVVVFRKSDEEAVVVAEVKCWKRLSRGLSKAKKQIRRFQKSIQNDSVDHMKGNGLEYSPEQFDENPDFITISQVGGVSKGFSMDIELTLDESHKLRQRLMRCQNRGECAKPE